MFQGLHIDFGLARQRKKWSLTLQMQMETCREWIGRTRARRAIE